MAVDYEDFYEREGMSPAMYNKREKFYDENVRECKACGGDLILVEKYAAVMYGNPEPGCELWSCICGYEEEG